MLIDLLTEEGVVGRSYLEPYAPNAMKVLVTMLRDLETLLRGRPVHPVELFTAARKSLHFVGNAGLSMIAASGLDMAAWDALARAAGLPLCVLLGGSVGSVPAYNSNGLWLQSAGRAGGRGARAVRRRRIHGVEVTIGARRRTPGCRRDPSRSQGVWGRSVS